MAREEKPFIPPPRKPVSEYQTPVPNVVFYTELVNRTDPAYAQNAPVKRGTLYSEIVGANQDVITANPDLFFVKERKFGTSDQLVLWDWSTQPSAEDTYNSEIDYVSNSVPCPAFTRVYTLRRDYYERNPTLPIGSPLTGLLGVIITSTGQDYTYATGTITGTDVEIQFVLFDGHVVSGVITNEGTGVTPASQIIITGDGSGATATVIVQPTGCVLTSQKKQELSPDDPLRNEFVRVIRTYETLPGPFIESTRIDDDGVVVSVKTRRNIADSIISGETLINGIWNHTTKKGVDDFVAEESVETREIPGNGVSSTRLDDDGKAVGITKTLKDTTKIVTAEVLSGGFWIHTTKEEVTDLVSKEVVEFRQIPGNPIISSRVDEDGKPVEVIKTLRDTLTITTQEILVGGVWNHTHIEQVSDLVSWEVVELRVIPGNPIIASRVDDDGAPVEIIRTLKDTTTIVTQEILAGGIWNKTSIDKVSDLVSWEVVELRAIPGNPIPSSRVDDDGKPVTVTRTLKDTTVIVTQEVLSGGIWNHTHIEQVSDLVSWEVVELRAIPGNPVPSARLDPDGDEVDVVTTLKDTTLITIQETLGGGVWSKTTKEAVSDLVSKELVETRAIPGNSVESTRLDDDGIEVDIITTLKDTTTITTQETLIAGVWSKTTKKSVSDLVAEENVESRTIPGNVVVSTEFERDGVTKTISKQLVATSSVITNETLTPNLLTRQYGQAVTDLVSNQIVETITVTSDSLLDLDDLTTTIPNVIPEIFRALIPTHVERHIVEGAPTEPALILGELEHSEKAITPLYKEVSSTLFDIGNIPITITGLKETNQDKEVVTVSMTLELDTTPPSTPNSLVDVEFRKLGNGLAVETLRTVPEVFPHGSYTKSVVDLIPPELRAAVPLVETDETSSGTASTNPTLLTGELSRNEEQVNKFDKRVRIKSLGAIMVPVSITATETDKDKQVVSIVYTLELSGTNAVVPTAFIDVDVKDLGNGYEVVTTRTVPTVFPTDSYSISIVNLIPERLRAAIPITETSIDAAGSPSTSPTLLTGELSRTESRLTEFTKRTRVQKLGTIVVPVTIVGQETSETYGGGILNVTLTLDSVLMSPDEGLTTVSSTVTDLGNGYFVKETRQLVDASWPILYGTHIDERYLIEIDIQKQTVDAGTTGGVLGDGTIVEVKPHDKWRSIQISSKLYVASLPGDTITYAGQRHSFPPELTDAVIDWAQGACGCSDSFSAILIANMKQYTGSVKTRMTEQFYNGVPPDDVTITQFFPETHNFGFAWASACGDADGNCRTKSGAPNFHIPLCLHGALSLTIGAFIVFNFAATTPAVLPHGNYIMLPPHVERWRFGVFRRVLTEVLVPP